jgi:hypothetical protein
LVVVVTGGSPVVVAGGASVVVIGSAIVVTGAAVVVVDGPSVVVVVTGASVVVVGGSSVEVVVGPAVVEVTGSRVVVVVAGAIVVVVVGGMVVVDGPSQLVAFRLQTWPQHTPGPPVPRQSSPSDTGMQVFCSQDQQRGSVPGVSPAQSSVAQHWLVGSMQVPAPVVSSRQMV